MNSIRILSPTNEDVSEQFLDAYPDGCVALEDLADILREIYGYSATALFQLKLPDKVF